MNKKISTPVGLAIIIIIAVLSGGVVYSKYQSAIEEINNNLVGQKPTIDARNATYIIEGKEVTLVNGRSEKETAPGSASKIITQYFGNEVKADFNSAGIEDVAFLLTQDSGGSGTFYYVAAVVSVGNDYKGTNAIFLGDRIAPQTTEFKDGEIIVNYADRKPGEPMSATPSVGVSRYFRINNGELSEVQK